MNLVITGTIGLDSVETPFGKVVDALGGSGVYACSAASYFVRPGLVSIVGEDVGHNKLTELKGIDVKGVEKKGSTFRWSGSYEYDMNEAKTLKTELNSLADFDPVLPQDYKSAGFLYLGNTDPSIQLKIISQMKNRPFMMLDTMNYWISTKKEELTKVIKKVDMIVINEGEARQFCETPNLIKAGRALLELGPKYVAIKKGEHGALLFSFNSYFSAPGYPLEDLKDPTGAGDSFAGGTIGYLAKTKDVSEGNIRKAIIYGSAVASFCAESFSLDYKKNIKIKDVEERYAVFQKIRQF